MLMELQNIIDGNISEKEIEKSKQIISNGFLFSNEKSGVIAHTLGTVRNCCNFRGSGKLSGKEYQVLQKNQIQSAVSKYLFPENIIEVTILPKGDKIWIIVFSSPLPPLIKGGYR